MASPSPAATPWPEGRVSVEPRASRGPPPWCLEVTLLEAEPSQVFLSELQARSGREVH